MEILKQKRIAFPKWNHVKREFDEFRGYPVTLDVYGGIEAVIYKKKHKKRFYFTLMDRGTGLIILQCPYWNNTEMTLEERVEKLIKNSEDKLKRYFKSKKAYTNKINEATRERKA